METNLKHSKNPNLSRLSCRLRDGRKHSVVGTVICLTHVQPRIERSLKNRTAQDVKRRRLRRTVIEEEARRLEMNSFASQAAHQVV